MQYKNAMAALIGMLATVSVAVAQEDCKQVKGRITSQLVSEFSNHEPCPSPIGLCTEGRFTGRLKGKFTFVASTLTPYAELDPTAPPDVAATTGVIRLRTRLCGGTLVLRDTSTFSLSPEGSFAGLDTADGMHSTGGCSGASGRLRLAGIFQAGCVDCKYEGEICGVGNRHDDDDHDSDDDSSDDD